MWINEQDENNKGPAIRVTIDNGYDDYTFPPSSLEPCISAYWTTNVDSKRKEMITHYYLK